MFISTQLCLTWATVCTIQPLGRGYDPASAPKNRSIFNPIAGEHTVVRTHHIYNIYRIIKVLLLSILLIGVPGGLVGDPCVYHDQFRGLESHRVHARRDFILNKKND